MNESKRDQVFISYAHEDLQTVKDILHGLKERKLKVWFDKEDIGPGPWLAQIMKAIARSRYFVICISKAALRKIGDEKPGFQDEELQRAYEIAQAQPVKEFTIVPVRLEECERGDFRITSFQQYDLFPDIDVGLDKLAVHIGGVSLADATAQDERTEDEKIIEGLSGKAESAYYANELEKALTIVDSILAINPDDAKAWYNKGVALDDLDRFEEALQAFDKVLALNPDDAIAWTNKGVALGNLNRTEEANHAFDKALALNPDDANAWYNKGAALNNLRRFEEALQAFDKVLILNPGDANTWTAKGIAFDELGRTEEAQKARDKASEIVRKHK